MEWGWEGAGYCVKELCVPGRQLEGGAGDIRECIGEVFGGQEIKSFQGWQRWEGSCLGYRHTKLHLALHI